MVVKNRLRPERENKHYFTPVYLTFDFEGQDLKTLSLRTVHVPLVINDLKVVEQTTPLTEYMRSAFF